MYKLEKPKEKLFCEKCGKLVDYETKFNQQLSYKVKGIDITINNGIIVYCKNCGNELLEPYYEDLNLKTAYEIYDSIIKHDAIKEEFEKFLEEKINKIYDNTDYLEIDVEEHNEDFNMCLEMLKNGKLDFSEEEISKFEKEGWLYYFFDLEREITEIVPLVPERSNPSVIPSCIIYDWNKVDFRMFDKWKEYINYFVE